MDLRADLQGKKALVTGASSGIGRATAVLLAQNGASVAVGYLSTADGAQETVRQIEECGQESFAVQADVSSRSDIEAMLGEVHKRFSGQLDILVNNAGDLIHRRGLDEMPEAVWDEVIDTNLKSVFLVSQVALPLLRESRSGRIINMSSIAGQMGGGWGAGHYAAAKAGVISLTKSMAKEFASMNITVNAIAPGYIETRYHDRHSTEEKRKQLLEGTPVGRVGTPMEVAATVLYLASDAAAFVTGHTISVNGGMYV